MYINKGKRDILIFPKFDNMDLIGENEESIIIKNIKLK